MKKSARITQTQVFLTKSGQLQLSVLLNQGVDYVIKEGAVTFKFALSKDDQININTFKNERMVQHLIRLGRFYKPNEEIKYETLLSSKKH